MSTIVNIASDIWLSTSLREELKAGSVEAIHIRRTGNGDRLSIDYEVPDGYKP